jgi:hypothetical protein
LSIQAVELKRIPEVIRLRITGTGKQWPDEMEVSLWLIVLAALLVIACLQV